MRFTFFFYYNEIRGKIKKTIFQWWYHFQRNEFHILIDFITEYSLFLFLIWFRFVCWTIFYCIFRIQLTNCLMENSQHYPYVMYSDTSGEKKKTIVNLLSSWNKLTVSIAFRIFLFFSLVQSKHVMMFYHNNHDSKKSILSYQYFCSRIS